jgi:hypothetical protein
MRVAVSGLKRVEKEEVAQTRAVRDELRRHCWLTGMRDFARRARIDPTNLNRTLKGRGEPGWLMLTKFKALLA